MSRLNYHDPASDLETKLKALKTERQSLATNRDKLRDAAERDPYSPRYRQGFAETERQIGLLDHQIAAAERELGWQNPSNEGRIDNSAWISGAHQKRYDI